MRAGASPGDANAVLRVILPSRFAEEEAGRGGRLLRPSQRATQVTQIRPRLRLDVCPASWEPIPVDLSHTESVVAGCPGHPNSCALRLKAGA
jgi:hypothetical protein